MTRPARDPAELAALVEQRVSQGLDLVDSFLAVTGRGSHRSGRVLAQEHRREVARQQRALLRHRSRLASLRSQSVGGAVVAGVTGSIGVIDVVASAAGSDVPAPSLLWFGIAAVSALISVRGHRRMRQLPAPPTTFALVGAPPTMRRAAIGASEVTRFAAVRVQVMTMAPALDRLYPGAGADLRRADAEAAAPLTALCERLRVLDDLQRELPGTSASASAASSAQVVRERLAAGCATYDDLLAAAARLLAAPDLARSTDEVLTPAVNAMLAYAHGLQRAADL